MITLDQLRTINGLVARRSRIRTILHKPTIAEEEGTREQLQQEQRAIEQHLDALGVDFMGV